jgi:hypothetical protein
VARAWSGVAAAVEDALRHAAVVAAYGGDAREATRCGAALDAHVGAVKQLAGLEAVIGAGTFYTSSAALVGVVWVGWGSLSIAHRPPCPPTHFGSASELQVNDILSRGGHAVSMARRVVHHTLDPLLRYSVRVNYVL